MRTLATRMASERGDVEEQEADEQDPTDENPE